MTQRRNSGRGFVKPGRDVVAQEHGTRDWYGFPVDDSTFGIFDAFEDEPARQAHLNGQIDAGQELEIARATSGARTFDLRGYLPDGRMPPRAIVELRETCVPDGSGAHERVECAYELLDHERDFRRAHHLHDRDVSFAATA